MAEKLTIESEVMRTLPKEWHYHRLFISVKVSRETCFCI